MNHYILPTLQEDHPGVILLHIGSNDRNNQTKDAEKLMENIINIVKSWINLGVKEVVISSTLPKKIIVLTRLKRQVNDFKNIYGKIGYM